MICVGVSKNHSVKVRCHPGAITFDLNDFPGSTCSIKADATIIHSWTNETNSNCQNHYAKITISGIVGKGGIDTKEDVERIKAELKRYCDSKVLLFDCIYNFIQVGHKSFSNWVFSLQEFN